MQHSENILSKYFCSQLLLASLKVPTCSLLLGINRSQIKLTVKKAIVAVVQSLSRVRFFVTPCTAARQTSLSITTSMILKFISIESVMPSSYLILCCSLLLLPSVFPCNSLSRVSSLHQVVKVLALQHHSFQ